MALTKRGHKQMIHYVRLYQFSTDFDIRFDILNPIIRLGG